MSREATLIRNLLEVVRDVKLHTGKNQKVVDEATAYLANIGKKESPIKEILAATRTVEPVVTPPVVTPPVVTPPVVTPPVGPPTITIKRDA